MGPWLSNKTRILQKNCEIANVSCEIKVKIMFFVKIKYATLKIKYRNVFLNA